MTDNSARPIAESGFQPRVRLVQSPDGGQMVADPREYATPERSRLDSGFYVLDRGLPWHVALSRRLDTPELMAESGRTLTVGEAIAYGGLDFDVEKVPVSVKTGYDKRSHRSTYQDVPGKYATVRTDTGTVLGVVGEQYRVLQNRDAFDFADAIVDSSGAHWETAGVLYGGRQVFMSMELPDDIHVIGDPSEYRLFLVLAHGHDGHHPVVILVTIERVVCRNTLRIAKDRATSSWQIRHTTSLDGRLTAARDALGVTFRYTEDFADTASRLVQVPLVMRQVDDILRDLFPIPESQDSPDKVDRSTWAAVRQVYQESPSVEPIRGTAYGVLNAVTEYLDHVQTYQGRQSDASDVKADSLMFGGVAEGRKTATMTRLMALVP